MRIEEITTVKLKKASDKELLSLRWNCNAQWIKHFAKAKDINIVVGCLSAPMLIAKYQLLIAEMSSRTLEKSTLELDRRAFAKAMENKRTGINLGILEEVTTCGHQIVVTKESFNEEEFTIVVVADKTEVLKKFEQPIREAAYKECKFVYNKNYSGACVPLYIQKMVPVGKIEGSELVIRNDVSQGAKREVPFNLLPVAKEDEDERIVYGIVYESETVDSQNDKASEAEIRKAAYQFMEEVQTFRVNHKGPPIGVRVLENYIAPSSFKLKGQKVKKGSWVLVTRILDDDVWEKIKSGEITGYSMAGIATAK
ncbi:hypothetical protein KAR91_08760 [Candidatus Pacearchaeota archaeon]|nr:hypothetical protein [Candidatus Pacearchaeota archaeon]